MEDLDEEFSFRCKICHAKFSFLRELRKHSADHNTIDLQNGNKLKTKDEPPSSLIMNVVNNSKNDFLIVKTEAAGPILKQVIKEPIEYDYSQENKPNNSIDKFECSICGEFLQTTKWIFDEHVKYHKKKGTVPCQVADCPKKFSTNKLLKSHELVKHNIGRPPSTICHICQYDATTMHRLKQHYIKHSDKRDYICNECGKGFKSDGVLALHIKKHNNEYNYFCDQCDDKFIQKGTLKLHIFSRHTPEKTWPFVCDECGKGFFFKHLLAYHSTKHTGEKKWKCEFCDKTFRVKYKRTTHELIHRGIKKFECTLCFKRFTRKTHLDVHMKYHNNQRDFVCDYCSGAWVEPSGLRRHKCPKSL